MRLYQHGIGSGGSKIARLTGAVIAGLLAVSGSALADVGFSIDASTLRFIYTKGAGGPGSIGRIDISRTSSSTVNVQQLNLGADGDFGGNDDTVIDLAKITGTGPALYTTIFTADVFQLGTNSYSIMGMYNLADQGAAPVVVAGDFESSFVNMSNGAFFFGGQLTNPNGVLQPGFGDGWTFTGNPAVTPNTINGMFGGADGIDGVVTLNSGRGVTTAANLFEFQFVANFPDLDAFFNSAVQASTIADLKVDVVVPAPGASLLGTMGLLMIGYIRRRFLPRVVPVFSHA